MFLTAQSAESVRADEVLRTAVDRERQRNPVLWRLFQRRAYERGWWDAMNQVNVPEVAQSDGKDRG